MATIRLKFVRDHVPYPEKHERGLTARSRTPTTRPRSRVGFQEFHSAGPAAEHGRAGVWLQEEVRERPPGWDDILLDRIPYLRRFCRYAVLTFVRWTDPDGRHGRTAGGFRPPRDRRDPADRRIRRTRPRRRQVGPIERPLSRPPEIEIEYVDRLPADGPRRLIRRDDAAFDRSTFVLLRGRFKAPVRVAIPLDLVGGRCRIVAERGAGTIPLLVPIVNVTALASRADPDPRLGVHPRGPIVPDHGLGEGRQERGPAVVRGARGDVCRRRVDLPRGSRPTDGRAAGADPAVGLAAPPDARVRRPGLPRPARPDRLDPRRGQRDRGGRRCAGGPRDRRRPDAPTGPAVRRSPARRPGPTGRPVRRPDRGRWGTARPGRRSSRVARTIGSSSSRSTAPRSPGGWSTRSVTNGSTCGRPT